MFKKFQSVCIRCSGAELVALKVNGLKKMHGLGHATRRQAILQVEHFPSEYTNRIAGEFRPLSYSALPSQQVLLCICGLCGVEAGKEM